MAGRSQRDMADMALLQDGIALADRLDWLLGVLELRMRQAISRDYQQGGGLRLVLLLGPGLTAVQGIRHDLERLTENYRSVQGLIQERILKVKG